MSSDWSDIKFAVRQWLIAIAILSLAFLLLWKLWHAMDRAAHQYDIVDKAKLGADYSAIFTTPLNKSQLLYGCRIPDSRVVYVLESPEPFQLRDPSLFSADTTSSRFPQYRWITKCLHRGPSTELAAGPQGDVFVYCNDNMKRICVLGYNKP